ncbi:YnbE family lipoprotein [Novosphingobium umbonatum]|jgi:hypothetical protein|nr:YnbE family lipoprotein [Novosphingobium umbonatum]
MMLLTQMIHAKSFRGLKVVSQGLVLGAMASALSGCITVQAPDKPIVIELNIAITQDVTYRLAPDAAKTIQNNQGIF